MKTALLGHFLKRFIVSKRVAYFLTLITFVNLHFNQIMADYVGNFRSLVDLQDCIPFLINDFDSLTTQDSVRVACRFRPINQRERDEGQSDVVVEILGGGTQVKYRGKKTQSFSFDRAFKPNASQQEVFDHTGAPLVDQVLQGINCTLFAYGQTGSGTLFLSLSQ